MMSKLALQCHIGSLSLDASSRQSGRRFPSNARPSSTSHLFILFTNLRICALSRRSLSSPRHSRPICGLFALYSLHLLSPNVFHVLIGWTTNSPSIGLNPWACRNAVPTQRDFGHLETPQTDQALIFIDERFATYLMRHLHVRASDCHGGAIRE